MTTLWNRLLSMLGLRKAPLYLAAPAHRPEPLRVPVEVPRFVMGGPHPSSACDCTFGDLDQPFSGHGYIDDPARRLVVRLPARGGVKS